MTVLKNSIMFQAVSLVCRVAESDDKTDAPKVQTFGIFIYFLLCEIYSFCVKTNNLKTKPYGFVQNYEMTHLVFCISLNPTSQRF